MGMMARAPEILAARIAFPLGPRCGWHAARSSGSRNGLLCAGVRVGGFLFTMAQTIIARRNWAAGRGTREKYNIGSRATVAQPNAAAATNRPGFPSHHDFGFEPRPASARPLDRSWPLDSS